MKYIRSLYLLGALIIVAVLLSLVIDELRENETDPVNVSNQSAQVTKPDTTKVATLSESEILKFLIEEEKLAHDVYTVLYQKYGSRVFGNILESESSHQDHVLVLLKDRQIQDPRSTKLGEFTDTNLQALYDQLVKQGMQSEREAYKVGVQIEEKDINDISTFLSKTSDQDMIDTLELLRRGSENHLRAFNRQL